MFPRPPAFRYTLCAPVVDSTAVAVAGKAKPAQHTLSPRNIVHHARQLSERLTFLLHPGAGQAHAPVEVGMLGSVSQEHSPAHSHSAWVQCSRIPVRVGSSAIPARTANAEESGKKGADEWATPTPGFLRCQLIQGSMEWRTPSSPSSHSCTRSLVLDLGSLGFQGQVRSLLIKVWSQLQQPSRFDGSHVSHVILRGLYNFIVDDPARWLLWVED